MSFCGWRTRSPALQAQIREAMRGYRPQWEDHLAHDWLRARLLGEAQPEPDAQTISRIHLSNLKNAVHWTVKLTQINILTQYVRSHPDAAFHTALHFSNLLCVSEHLPVREAAGNALLAIAPQLLVDQINEIVIDLTRELESGQEQISRFIPPYLGRLLCQLPEKELHESVESIGALASGASIRPARVALFTLGEALNVLPEAQTDVEDRILGLILTGIAHYDETIHQTALAVLCRDIFGRSQLPMARKHAIFVRLHKKAADASVRAARGTAHVLQLRGHAEPSLPLHRPAGAAGGALPLFARKARRVLPRHLRPLFRRPQADRAGDPRPRLRGLSGRR